MRIRFGKFHVFSMLKQNDFKSPTSAHTKFSRPTCTLSDKVCSYISSTARLTLGKCKKSDCF